MKSAYERALEKFGPIGELRDEQKEKIAEIDSIYKAKIASEELSFREKIATAGPDEADKLRRQMSIDINRLKEKAQAEKDKVRNEE